MFKRLCCSTPIPSTPINRLTLDQSVAHIALPFLCLSGPHSQHPSFHRLYPLQRSFIYLLDQHPSILFSQVNLFSTGEPLPHQGVSVSLVSQGSSPHTPVHLPPICPRTPSHSPIPPHTALPQASCPWGPEDTPKQEEGRRQRSWKKREKQRRSL